MKRYALVFVLIGAAVGASLAQLNCRIHQYNIGEQLASGQPLDIDIVAFSQGNRTVKCGPSLSQYLSVSLRQCRPATAFSGVPWEMKLRLRSGHSETLRVFSNEDVLLISIPNQEAIEPGWPTHEISMGNKSYKKLVSVLNDKHEIGLSYALVLDIDAAATSN